MVIIGSVKNFPLLVKHQFKIGAKPFEIGIVFGINPPGFDRQSHGPRGAIFGIRDEFCPKPLILLASVQHAA